jgi:hypothetical protein
MLLTLVGEVLESFDDFEVGFVNNICEKQVIGEK